MRSGHDFVSTFEALTGYRPLSWQMRLYEEHFVKGNLLSVIDISTGLGKTMVMAIWLVAKCLASAGISCGIQGGLEMDTQM